MDRQELKELLDGISESLDIKLGASKSMAALQNNMATIKMILETTVQYNFNQLVEGHIGLIR